MESYIIRGCSVWLYDIKNISDYDIEKMVFGYIVGTITGGDGDSGDDWANFEKEDDIAYSYDNGTDLETGLGGIGASGWSPVRPNIMIDLTIGGMALRT